MFKWQLESKFMLRLFFIQTHVDQLKNVLHVDEVRTVSHVGEVRTDSRVD